MQVKLMKFFLLGLILLSSNKLGFSQVSEHRTELEAEFGIKIWPKIQFPLEALNDNKEGKCEVVFNLLQNGTPIDLVTYCSDDIFCADASEAVRKASFDHKRIIEGKLQSTNIKYPLLYAFENSDLNALNDLPLYKCRAALVS